MNAYQHTPDRRPEPEETDVDGRTSSLVPPLPPGIRDRIKEEANRFFDANPHVAPAFVAHLTEFEKRDPIGSRAFTYRMFGGRTPSAAAWLGKSEADTRRLIRRAAADLATELERPLWELGLAASFEEIVNEQFDRVARLESGAIRADAPGSDSTTPNGRDDPGATPPTQPLQSSGRQAVAAPDATADDLPAATPPNQPLQSSGRQAVAAPDATADDLPAATQPASLFRRVLDETLAVTADSVARLRDEHWDAYAGVRERLAFHDLREETAGLRARGVVFAARALSRVAWAAARYVGERIEPDPLEGAHRLASDEDLLDRMKASARRLLGAVRAEGLWGYESRRGRKALAALEALEPKDARLDGARPGPRAVQASVPPDLGPMIEAVAAQYPHRYKRPAYEPMAIFDVDGRVIAAAAAPSIEVLIEAALHKTKNPALFERADLRGVAVHGLDLHKIVPGVSLAGAWLQQSTWTDCVFDKVNLTDARLDRTRFDRTSFVGARFTNASMRWARLQTCRWNGANTAWKDEMGLRITSADGLAGAEGPSAAVARELYRQGIIRQRQGHFTDAEALFAKATERDTRGCLEYHLARADMRYALGDPKAGDSYLVALDAVAQTRGASRAFRLYYAIAISAARRNDERTARAALDTALGPTVRRSVRASWRAERAYGLLEPATPRTIPCLTRAFNYEPNDRAVAWRLAETTHTALVESAASERDPVHGIMLRRSLERLEILERGNPDQQTVDRIRRLAAVAQRIEAETAARRPAAAARPEAREQLRTADAPPEAFATPEIVNTTKASVETFFAIQSAHAQTVSETLADRVGKYQAFVRDEMARIPATSPIWTEGEARTAREGWRFLAELSRLNNPTEAGLLADLGPGAGETTGAVRTDRTGRLLGPRGEVVVDADGRGGLHQSVVEKFASPQSGQGWIEAMTPEGYSQAGRVRLLDAVSLRGAPVVAAQAAELGEAVAATGVASERALCGAVPDVVKQLSRFDEPTRAELQLPANTTRPRLIQDRGR